MLTYQELDEYITELSEYAQYEGTEIGEYWATLINLQDEMDYMSTPFKEAYQQEIIDTLKFIKENYKWGEVTTTQSYVVKPVVRKTLKRIGGKR